MIIAALAMIFWLDKKRCLPAGLRPGRDLPYWAFGLIVLCVVVFERIAFWASAPVYGWDFLNAYYPAGQAALQNDPSILSVYIGKGTQGFVNLPITAYLFAPLALFPPDVAMLLFTAIGLGFAVLAWFLLVRLAGLELRERWLLAVLFLANGGIIDAAKLGNLSYFLIAALAGGLLLVRSGRTVSAAVLLGLAAVIKPPFALFGLFFLLRRDWRGSLSFAGVGLAAALMSLAVYGWDLNYLWFENSVLHYSHNWFATFNVQSFSAFIMRLRPDVRLDLWVTNIPTSGERLANQILTALAFLVAAAASFRLPSWTSVTSDRNPLTRLDLQYLLVVCLCLISSPLNWSHYYSWLLMPMAFFLSAQNRLSLPERAVAWGSIMLVTALQGWPLLISSPILMAPYKTLFVSHIFVGGLVWFGLVAWWLANAGGLGTRWSGQEAPKP